MAVIYQGRTVCSFIEMITTSFIVYIAGTMFKTAVISVKNKDFLKYIVLLTMFKLV